MKARCGSCTFFRKYQPAIPKTGYDYECLRTPGYYRSPVEEACKFYAKKVKKMAKKEAKKPKVVKVSGSLDTLLDNVDVFCSKCQLLIGKEGPDKYWYGEPLCQKCLTEKIKEEGKESLKEAKNPKKELNNEKVLHELFLVIWTQSTLCNNFIPYISPFVFKTKNEAVKFIKSHNLDNASFCLNKITSKSTIEVENIRLNRTLEEGLIEKLGER